MRIEIGPRDLEEGKAVIVRRDNGEKIECPIGELADKITELIPVIQKSMLETARAHRDEHTYSASSWEEFNKIFEEKAGFVKAMWCGNRECEDKIKEQLAVTSRCMPFEQETISDKCVCCGQKAQKMVYWGRAY